MPWRVERAAACPDDRPWGVINTETGEKAACHETEESAAAQVRALYANVDEARSFAFLDNQREIRSAAFKPIDVADDGSWFEGYAAVFDEDASFELADGTVVTESVQRGAFRKALANEKNVPMLYHHLETHPPLATTQGGTLILEEDAKGLRTRANVAKGYIGDAVRELVQRGDIPGMSWGFIAGKGNSKFEKRGGVYHRTLTGFKRILDVSPTWDPSYRGTEAQFRAQVFGGFLPGEMQQLGLGERQQGDEQGTQDGDEERAATAAAEGATGATAEWRSVAARKRELQFLVVTTGGIEDETR